MANFRKSEEMRTGFRKARKVKKAPKLTKKHESDEKAEFGETRGISKMCRTLQRKARRREKLMTQTRKKSKK
jgi:hypothetical protein